MKIAVVGLVLLGIVAAMAAAALVAMMGNSGIAAQQVLTRDASAAQVTVLLATRALPAMSVIDANCVTSKTISRGQAPAAFISSPVEIMGKVLAVPVVEGQAFTKAVFSEAAGIQIAAALAPGKRAFGISVTEYGGLEGLLYPGSLVDVILSFKPQGGSVFGNDSGDSPTSGAISRTILEGVEVLGIDQRTVTSAEQPPPTAGQGMHVSNSRRITLLVNTRQAKILQLAQDQGTLSLSLRNPLDQASIDSGSVSLYDLLDEKPSLKMLRPDSWQGAMKALQSMFAAKATEPAPPPLPQTRPADPPAAPKWEVMVIRGDKADTEKFDLPPVVK